MFPTSFATGIGHSYIIREGEIDEISGEHGCDEEGGVRRPAPFGIDCGSVIASARP
jgi:hypothetical protein